MNDTADDAFSLQTIIHKYRFSNFTVESLNETIIAQHTIQGIYTEGLSTNDLVVVNLQINQGVFTRKQQGIQSHIITITQEQQHILLTCDCNATMDKLCLHEAEVLVTLLLNNDVGIFFKPGYRHQQLKKIAKDYGLDQAENFDEHFDLSYEDRKLNIIPRNAALLPVTEHSIKTISHTLALFKEDETFKNTAINQGEKLIVLRQHKFHKFLMVDLLTAIKTKDGKFKNPLNALSPLDLLWQSDDNDLLKFFAAIHKLQQHTDGKRTLDDIQALKAIIKNPKAYATFLHDPNVSEKITTGSIIPASLHVFTGRIILNIQKSGDFFELSGIVENRGVQYAIKEVFIKLSYFLELNDAFYLIEKPDLFNLIDFLKQRDNDIVIHTSKFKQFKEQILEKLADKVIVNYKYIQAASQYQLKEQGFDHVNKKIIYLSESGHHIVITPTISYSDVEIPIRSKRQIYAQDNDGNDFLVKRDDKEEIALTALIARQHPFFEEQVENDHDHFYLHKERFMDETWFPDVFEEWANNDILVLGFNELEGNRINPHKVKVNVKVLSGINWFNAEVKVFFGKKKAPLKSIQKSIRDKSKYVALDDGTLGILPQEWIEKFSQYFNAGDLDESSILISKVNYSLIETLFDTAELDKATFDEIQKYNRKWDAIHTTNTVTQPVELQGVLRPYQLQGLNWLNFLDDLNFGGCLADDMGLGKSVQVIAFLLLQRTKVERNVNLLVVPATLISNWQNEFSKFAPSLKVFTLYGNDRSKSTKGFQDFEVILTTYGTLLSDIEFLKSYTFNYIFLDESQNIKNPESQRYKAVRLLQSRNRIAITGTPLENNTFDLYSQLSFACPGLLGSKQYFKDVYATPIDTFKVSKRLKELQQRIQPFLLRRTKQQVAQDLPAKTEMILYCEMEAPQRKIYDAYEKEFREYISAATDDELKKSSMHVLRGLTKLRQICNAPVLVKSDNLTETASAKLKALLQQISEKSQHHKILVFSQFVSMLDLIKTELEEQQISFAYLTGQTKNRASVIDSFQNNEDVRIFLISLKAGGTGLNLTQADYVYLVDPWWNPAVENQAIDRVHRIGQDKHVIAVRLICPNTVEDKILKMQETKRTLTDNLIKAESNTGNVFSKMELLKLLG